MDEMQRFLERFSKIFCDESEFVDSGLGRLLNLKRALISEFVYKKLPGIIEDAIRKHAGIELMNDKVFMQQIFDDLYTFFSRYFDSRDCVVTYKQDYKYKLPYDGNEVLFHWRNKGSYYVGSYCLRVHSFEVNGYKIYFRPVVKVGDINNFAKKMFFVVDSDRILEQSDQRCVIIYVNYRELTELEREKFKDTNKRAIQKQLVEWSCEQILEKIKDNELKQLLNARVKSGETVLMHNFLKFVSLNRRFDRDYFIHKDLKGFLSRELDYFIKSEILWPEIFEKK